MYKIQAFTKVMLVTGAVIVNAAVFAIVGVPWAVSDPPINAGGGSPGGGGRSGGIADALEGASGSDGLWSATVGGIEHAGLGAGDVGRTLWRGSKVDRAIMGDDGIPRTIQVCGGFPEIVLEISESGIAPGGGGATVELDLVNCTVALSELTRTSTGAMDSSDTQGAGPQNLAWHPSVTDSAVPVSWRDDLYPDSSTPHRRQNYANWRSTRLFMQMRAADRFGFKLTETKVVRSYWTDTRNTRAFSKFCVARSPARGLGVFWRQDGCTGGHYKSAGRSRAWAQGRFHGEISGTIPLVNRPMRFSGSTRHTMNLMLEGSSTRDLRRCTVSPTSIRNLRVIAPYDLVFRGHEVPNSLGVSIACGYRSITGRSPR